MSAIIKELQGLISIYFTMLVIFIGLFSFFVDGLSYKKSNDKKEEKISKIIGISYIIIGPVLFITLQLI